MGIKPLVFYCFSFLAIISSGMVIVSKNTVRAALFLVFSFFCMAAIWLLLESEFLAITLILVYVGAVMVLFLFVVMMLDLESPQLKAPFVKHWPVGVGMGCLLFLILALAVGQKYFDPNLFPEPLARPADYSHIKALGTLLFADYLLPFEVAGVILLVAMVAAIGLTFRGPRGTKPQKPGLQVQVRKQDRLKIMQIKSEE